MNEEGYREVLAVEPAGRERKEGWRNLLKGLLERGLQGVRRVISDDHPSIRRAVMAKLPGAGWRRCVAQAMGRGLWSAAMLEGLFREVKRRSGVVGVFPNEESLADLATVVMLRVTEEWGFRRHMDMTPLWAAEEKPTKIAT
ncbi:transposase [Thermus tenuipuniceus]|uniref:transposase n=1 Tax=Thermus tenuipuniceus TaxID=2078690 RepID=UPI000FF881EE|nr:transposase [Thermus tenuipuniceus]